MWIFKLKPSKSSHMSYVPSQFRWLHGSCEFSVLTETQFTTVIFILSSLISLFILIYLFIIDRLTDLLNNLEVAYQ